MDSALLFLKDLFGHDKDNPLIFSTLHFLILFCAFYAVYIFIYKKSSARVLFTLAFSLFFYYKCSERYIVILIFSIVLDYFLGFAIHEAKPKLLKKLWLWISISLNVGLLFYFKYTNFFIENVNELTGSDFNFQKIFLPIGISFYTFQTLSYVIDIYRGILSPIKNLWDYAFYMSFFPHLVAGPIVRAKDFLPQIHQEIDFSKNKLNIGAGYYLIIKGLFKKVIISNYITQYVDIVYANPEGYSGFEHLIAMYAYAIQIYCDFSGYSDMAIGIAKLMGYELGLNFNSPYQSLSITEFWRRWHISLSSWLKDYIYIPLGGSKVGKFRRFLNLFLTMLIGGFWHGANYKFIFWGAGHGIGLVLHKLFDNAIKKSAFWKSAFWKIIAGLLTFHFVAFLWIYFRMDSFASANYSIYSIFNRMDFNFSVPFYMARPLLVWILAIGFISHLFPLKYKNWIGEKIGNAPFYVKSLILFVIIQIMLQIQTEGVQPFIYFQF